MRSLLVFAFLIAAVAMTDLARATTLTYTTGLDVWLDAQDINNGGSQPSDGATVATWVNKGTTGVGNAAGNGVFDADGGPSNLGVKAAVTLNGSTQWYLLPEFMDSPTLTAYFVAVNSAGVNHQVLYADSATGGTALITAQINTANRVVVADSGNDRLINTTIPLVGTSWDIGLMRLSESAGAFTLESGVYGSTALSTNPAYNSTTWQTDPGAPQDGPYLGRARIDGFAFNGRFAEVLIFNHALSTTDRATVENYLDQKYFTPIPEPASVTSLAVGALLVVLRRRAARERLF